MKLHPYKMDHFGNIINSIIGIITHKMYRPGFIQTSSAVHNQIGYLNQSSIYNCRSLFNNIRNGFDRETKLYGAVRPEVSR